MKKITSIKYDTCNHAGGILFYDECRSGKQ